MRNSVLVLAASLLALPALAQRVAPPVAVPLAPLLAADASLACAKAHIGQAQRAAAITTTSVRHRQKMDRYDVQWYGLNLNLENNSRDISGSVTMRVRVLQPLDSVAFELYQAPVGSPQGTPTLTIDTLKVNGQLSPGVLRQGNDATAALPQPAAAGTVLEVRIAYHGTAPHGNTAAIGNAFNTATSYRLGNATIPYNVTWSLSEPFSAHEWFPCKQVLTDKADSSMVAVTTTLPNKVGSNGLLRRTTLLPNNKVRYEWHEHHPIDYYLISVAVAPYIEYTNYAYPAGGPQVPIRSFVYDQQALDYYQTEFDRIPGFIENYSRLFGTYYFADEKYGLALAPIGGGMEHQTLTTQDGLTFTLTAHELFHQWFGDNVTCASWEDIWLNEAFASYGEYMSLQAFASQGDARAWMDNAQSNATSYGGGTGTVYVPDTTDVDRIFQYQLTYKKGAAVVHMLRYLCHDDTHVFNDEQFYRVLRTYQQQYSGRTARTADLQRLFEAELGTSLDYFFQQWYRGEGFPTFNVTWNQVGGTLYLKTDETASQPTSVPFFKTDVDYFVTFQDGSGTIVRMPQNQASVSRAFTFAALKSGTVASIKVDPDGWLPDLPGTVQRDNSLVLATKASQPLALNFYPNPARTELTISEMPATAATAEISDALGRVVARQALAPGQSRVAVQALRPGFYYLRLVGTGQQVLGQGKFVRE